MLDRDRTEKNYTYHIGNYPWKKAFEEYLKNGFGFSLKDIYGHGKEFNRQIINVHYFVQLQDEARKAHQKNGFIIN